MKQFMSCLLNPENMKKKQSTFGDRVLNFIDYFRTNLLLWALVVFLVVLLLEAFDFPF